MKLDILPVVGKMHASKLMNTTVIVIDVLRSTSCMIAAIQNGASKIIPTSDPGEAASFVARLGSRDSLLAGETGGIKIPGFDMGNSPLEFTAEKVKGRTIIMSTTNGTNAVCAMAAADIVYIGSMINASAVAKKAYESGHDILIACSGTDGKISADDLLAAGAIAEEIIKLSGGSAEQSDTTRVCRWVYKGYMDGRVDIEDSFHYSRLEKLGFAEDLQFCFKRDASEVVPEYKNGIIQ